MQTTTYRGTQGAKMLLEEWGRQVTDAEEKRERDAWVQEQLREEFLYAVETIRDIMEGRRRQFDGGNAIVIEENADLSVAQLQQRLDSESLVPIAVLGIDQTGVRLRTPNPLLN